ncbi:hypothetical protein EDB19DRAFT_1918725 [Suillus lakei]|nr:hypothetical protein EDB19DRAFT_1918725 [Suillus lakei]
MTALFPSLPKLLLVLNLPLVDTYTLSSSMLLRCYLSCFTPKSLSILLNASPSGCSTSTPASASPHKFSTTLFSTRDPLSIPIATVNLRRFVASIGPIWDRKLLLSSNIHSPTCYTLDESYLLVMRINIGEEPISSDHSLPSKGSVDWQTKLQMIQNIMGAFSDARDFSPLTSHPSYRSTHTSPLLTLALLSCLWSCPSSREVSNLTFLLVPG